MWGQRRYCFVFAYLAEMDTIMACLYPVEKDLLNRENLVLKKAVSQLQDCKPEQMRDGGSKAHAKRTIYI